MRENREPTWCELDTANGGSRVRINATSSHPAFQPFGDHPLARARMACFLDRVDPVTLDVLRRAVDDAQPRYAFLERCLELDVPPILNNDEVENLSCVGVVTVLTEQTRFRCF